MLKHLLTLLVCYQAVFIGVHADDNAILNVAKKKVMGAFEGPTAVTVDAGYAYVCNLIGRSVHVVDIQTNSVVATIQDPTMDAPFKIAILNGYAYVCNLHANTLSIIDTTHQQFVRTIADDIQASRNITTALVAGAPRAFIVDEGVMQVVDLTLPTHPRVLQTLSDASINGLGICAQQGNDGSVYVTAGTELDQGELLVYSQIGGLFVSSPSSLAAPQLSGGRLLSAITTVGEVYAYVCDQLNDAVLVYDLQTNSYVTSIEGFAAPTALASNGRDVYVCNFAGLSAPIIRTAVGPGSANSGYGLTVPDSLPKGGAYIPPLPTSSAGLQRSFRKDIATVSIIDVSNHTVKGSVDGFYAPQAVATVPGFPGMVYFIDASAGTISGDISTGGSLSQALFPTTNPFDSNPLF